MAAIERRLVSKELQRLMAEVVDVEKDMATPVTLAQRFARRLIEMAMGYTETLIDDHGDKQRIAHDPEPWALKEVLDRYEGKPIAIVEESSERLVASERVTDMLRERLNKLTAQVNQQTEPAETAE